MKITETDKGNIKIVMTQHQAAALSLLLDGMNINDYNKFVDNEYIDAICGIWDELEESRHIIL